MSEQTTQVELAKNWFTNLMTYFRREYEGLSPEEKKFFSNDSNYLSPCQIEVIWLRQPEHQFVITSNFSDRPDMEVLIDGPYSGEEFIVKVEEVLNSPRWNRPVKDDRIAGATSYSEILASRLNMFMNLVRSSVLGPSSPPGSRLGMIVASNVWTSAHSGDLTKTDYVSVANAGIPEIRSRHASFLNAPASPSSQPKETGPDGFLTFFYPPITPGQRPKPTIAAILHGATFESRPFEKAFDMSFRGKDVVVKKSGLIFVAEKSREEALRVLNTIMAVGTLRGLNLYAVREHELGEGNYNKEKKELGGSSYPLSTMRMMQGDMLGRPFLTGSEVGPQQLQEVIREAERLYPNSKLVEELRLFIESYTHLHDSEYAQSFILSWTIIERYFYELWGKKLIDMDIDEGRQSKLLNTVLWSADYLIEVLNMTHDISEIEYEEYMELKGKRNRFIHKGKPVSKEDAERCIKTAREIVLKKFSK